jgi:hypothetical protein
MITIETLRDQISNMERAGKGDSLLCKKLKASLAKLQGEKKRDKNGRFTK